MKIRLTKWKWLLYLHLFGLFFFLALTELSHSKRCPLDPTGNASIEDWIAISTWEASVPGGLLATMIVGPHFPRCGVLG